MEVLIGKSWEHMGKSWEHMGKYRKILGKSWDNIGKSWEHSLYMEVSFAGKIIVNYGNWGSWIAMFDCRRVCTYNIMFNI
jgi:hypothetical protein